MPPLVALLVDWVITAFWPIIGAAGMAHFSGLLFSAAGLVVGFLCIAPFLARKGRWRRLVAPDVRWNLLAIGFFSGGATVIYISALAYTTPANAAIMAQIEVLYSAILCRFFLGERLGRSQAFATIVILSGTSLIMLRDLGSPRWKGDLMILATPWMYQVSHIFSKRLPKDLDPVQVSGGRILFGLLALAPFVAFSLATGGYRWSWSPDAMGMLALQGVTMSCVNFVLWYMAILRMDLSKATAIMLSYPALTVLFSWLLGREQIHASQLAGLVVTFAGAYWMSRLVLAAQKGVPARETLQPKAAAEL